MDFQGGVNGTNEQFQGGHGKFDWKSREVNFESISSTGGYNSFWKNPIHSDSDEILFDALKPCAAKFL